MFGYVGAFAPVGGVVDTGSGERVYGNRGFLLPELVKEDVYKRQVYACLGRQPVIQLNQVKASLK